MGDPEFELTDELASLIEALHDSEINGEIGWFFDGVWRVKIGDPWNGFQVEKDGLFSLSETARWLCDKAIELYPDSAFAEEYLRAHPDHQPHFPPEKPTPNLAARTGHVRRPLARRHRR